MYDSVRSSIRQFGNFTEAQLSEITQRLKFIVLPKGRNLIKEGNICRAFYFVQKGGFRQYTILETGVEATMNLWTERDWLFDYKSFISQQPAVSVIQAAEDSEVFEFSVWDFHELVKISDSFFQAGRIMQQAIQNQDFQHNRITPEEKYELLMTSKPEILQKFPLKHIASYLGITPETLSRIRRKIIS
ncbi:MAG: Crp/Fnr family transcriptional regulator [Chitinophagaceae bacterium]